MPEEDFHLSVHARLQAHECGSSASGLIQGLRLFAKQSELIKVTSQGFLDRRFTAHKKQQSRTRSCVRSAFLSQKFLAVRLRLQLWESPQHGCRGGDEDPIPGL